MPNMPSVSFEFFPPRTEEGDLKLNKTIKTLSEFNPEFFSVTFGAGGSTKAKTLETVLTIEASNNNGVPHLSCISASKEDIRNLINDYKSHDVKHLIALRGDNPSGAISHGDFKYANELISFIREETGEYFHIQAGAYPEYHPEAESATDDLNNFKRKIEAGANSAITQFFFNADAYFRFVEECQKLSISVPIIPGIMPIYNIKQLSRFSSNCGAEIPRWLRLKLESYDDDIQSLRDYGVDVVSELCETLVQYGVPGIHFYTLNESKIVSKIIKNINN